MAVSLPAHANCALVAALTLWHADTGQTRHVFQISSFYREFAMPDEPDDLRATLDRLHEQLRGAANISPETRGHLKGVLEDIHALLGDEPPKAGESATGSSRDASHESIVRRLTSAEREFEVTHPTLAGIVGSVIDALGRMGI
jgi:Domain of unknown function (DUF4404)